MHLKPQPKSIQLNVVSAAALLDSGSPMTGCGLHPDVAESIWTQAELHRPGTPLQFDIAVPHADVEHAHDIQTAIATHFHHQAEQATRELRQTFRQGSISAVIALVVMTALRLCSQAIGVLDEAPILTTITEGLTIFSWVAMWRPAELLLYHHWPIRCRRNLATLLATAPIHISEHPPSSSVRSVDTQANSYAEPEPGIELKAA